MKDQISFMQGTVGRTLRVVLGLVLIYAGLAVVGGTAGSIVAVIGLLPIVKSVWRPCLPGFVFRST
jgi:hypothetical protein